MMTEKGGEIELQLGGVAEGAIVGRGTRASGDEVVRERGSEGCETDEGKGEGNVRHRIVQWLDHQQDEASGKPR